ncbi:2-oxoglutarate and iron-dependent oxygenase domain-containing protein [Chlorogloeopsis sp. ULAP01]|uniref:isopenicillin N synthase family dioxygenase n=1 Tax=Chlorogloeopsis sp. ULAP01 TaxID=3056483 RepID=UPI0025AAE2FD|nr:2-oxoglutarate and iron-dependent oxygenase domain-containing protein [Chlorogloeopsis sp. ULAP01]MDM9383417.1 2-oxoglutarate and iron-dependent oxygenase domain-containing protein [Chlorogloeopsis sp. ULAP01]
MVNIPIINFSLFCNNNYIDRQTVVKQINQACHEIGFMYLQNHGIPTDLIKQIFSKSKVFFNLPLELKQRLAWSDEFSNQGYVGIERERLDANNPGDLKEAFNVGQKDAGTRGHDDAENFYVSCLSSPAKDSSILDFYRACTELSNKILQAFALALQLPEDFFTTRHTEQNHTLRLLHYPPVQKPLQPRQVRAGEHSDYGSITLLFQDEIGGLEIQTTAGQWIAAPAIPDTVIVNTGDLMQRWTNHVFCSTRHRVMIPTDERVKQSRYSVAFFCHPNNNTEIACLESCQKEHPPIYPPILAGEYLLSRLRATY